MTLRDRIIGGVVAALAVGASVTVAIQTSADQNAVTFDVANAETRDAIVDATAVLRVMGREADAVVDIMVEQTGAPREALAPVVALGFGRDGRHPRSLRTATVTIAATLSEADAARDAWATAFCSPLLLGGQPTSLHAECVASQRPQGTTLCAAGQPVGVVWSQAVTEPQAESIMAAWPPASSPVPSDWSPCPAD